MIRRHILQTEAGGLADATGGDPAGGLADSQKVTPSTYALQTIEGGKDGVWREVLPPEIRAHKGFDNFSKNANPLGDIAKSWIEMDRMYRESDKIPRLKADASAQDNAKYFQQHFGVPKTTADYGEVPTTVPVKVGDTMVDCPIDPTRYEKMREAAHYMNMLPKQFEGLVLADAAMQLDAEKGRTQHKVQIEDMHTQALLEVWGPHAYEEKTAQATAAFLHFAPDLYEELDGLRDENGVRLTSHHAFRQLMAAVGAATKEALPLPSGQTQVAGVPTPGEAATELAQFKKYGTDEWNIMGDRNHTRHTEVKTRYNYLMRIAHPGTAADREAELGNDGRL
jgi:hypothetical protein